MANLIDLDLSPPSTGNTDLDRWLEENMRRIQKFLRIVNATAAYGGMRYFNLTPPAATIGTTFQQITLFDQTTPLVPLFISYDNTTDELVIGDEGDGPYFIFFHINFEGAQGVIYEVEARIDDGLGGGPVPAGDPVIIRVSGADPYAEIERGGLYEAQAGWRISLWAKADTASATFNIFAVRFEIFRIGSQIKIS